jgi:perosamine synthetase
MRTTSLRIPLTAPTIGEEEEQAVLDVLRSGWLVQGRRVADFERRVADYCGARHGIATTNCTTALQLALQQLNLRPGDEVVVPSFTFVASVNAVVHAGGTPRLTDVDARTWNIDTSVLESAISRRTRAIMPVDQFGLAADLHIVHQIADRHRLAVIEDAAPALGAAIGAKRVGSLSPVTCFSFHPRKTITTAEGGMIVTNSDDVAARARMMRSHAASVSDLSRHQAHGIVIEKYDDSGFNFRMSDLHAAVGLAQMDRLDALISRRRSLAQAYNLAFSGLESIETPFEPTDYTHTYQTYCIVITDACRLTRNEAMQALLDRGIATRRGCMAVHLEPYFVQRFGLARLPAAERLAASSIALPLYPSLADEEQNYVIEQVRELLS